MTNAYVEYRPLSSDPHKPIAHHVVIVNGTEVRTEDTQLKAEKWACSKGHTVHVARERHRQDKPNPAHWRVSDCKP